MDTIDSLVSDPREARLTNEATDARLGTGLREMRLTDGRYDQADPAQYSEVYGTTLSKAQEEALNKNQSEFKTSVDTATNDLNTAKEQLDTAYNTGKTDLNNSLTGLFPNFNSYSAQNYSTAEAQVLASPWLYQVDEGEGLYHDDSVKKEESIKSILKDNYIDIISSNSNFNSFYSTWLTSNTVPVVVDDVHGNVTTFYVDKATADNNIAKIDFAGYGGVAPNEQGGYNVWSDTYASQIQQSLTQYSRELKYTLADSYATQLPSTVQQQLSGLESQYSLANDSLTSQRNQVDMVVNENTATLNTIRTQYANKLADIKETIGSMIYG